jgi:hypothetical protein
MLSLFSHQHRAGRRLQGQTGLQLRHGGDGQAQPLLNHVELQDDILLHLVEPVLEDLDTGLGDLLLKGRGRVNKGLLPPHALRLAGVR